ncbi:MAG: serine/threonine-protein phosphatase [Phycisphaeraceae bacterium]|nr:serine/threonine-protein phosphatase [Phycisphaeraceae bacterium]
MTPEPVTTRPASPELHTMHCMEVWGGNREIDNGVVMPGLDAWVYARPYKGSDETSGGGDVHYVSSCATGRITRVLIADVAGHGEGVDQLARGLRVLMRKFINYTDQTRFVNRLNREFHELSRDCKFATAVVLTYWGPNGHLSVCNAGHPRPLVYRAQSRQWSFLRDESGADNIPLGIDPGTVYGPYELRTKVGDIVLLYTDALIEARGTDGKLLGEEGLLALVRTLDAADPGALIHEIVERLRSMSGSADADDDVTMLALRNNGVGASVGGLGTGLRAGWDLTRALAGSLKPGGKVMGFPQMTWTNFAGAFSKRINKRFGKGG